MGKNHILLLILENTCLFCNVLLHFLCITGNHNYLDSCIIENLSLNRICSTTLSQTKDAAIRRSFHLQDFSARKEASWFSLPCTAFFVGCCKLLQTAIPEAYIVCYFINDILCSTLQYTEPSFQSNCCTLLFRIKSTDIFNLVRIIVWDS